MPTFYVWRTRGLAARDEPPPTLDLTRQGLIDLLEEAEVQYPPCATKTALLDLVVQHRQGPFIEFLEATKRAGAVRTLESLARIELGAQGGARLERVTTTRTVVRMPVGDWLPEPDSLASQLVVGVWLGSAIAFTIGYRVTESGITAPGGRVRRRGR